MKIGLVLAALIMCFVWSGLIYFIIHPQGDVTCKTAERKGK